MGGEARERPFTFFFSFFYTVAAVSKHFDTKKLNVLRADPWAGCGILTSHC